MIMQETLARSAPTSTATTGALSLEAFFAGRTLCYGWFEDRFGVIRRRFTVDINGHWSGRVLTLDEHFAYDDGETETRVWRLTPDRDGRYVADCDQLVRPVVGRVDGAQFTMRYDFRMKFGARTMAVHFEDWMHQQSDSVMLNRSRISKWGIHLGTACLVFHRQG
jgi:hypothetical protein